MVTSIYTGKQIMENIIKMEKDLKDMSDVLCLIEDEKGLNSPSYKLLRKEYDRLKEAYHISLDTEYTF